MGITWVVGILFFDNDLLPFAYIFTVFVAFQVRAKLQSYIAKFAFCRITSLDMQVAMLIIADLLAYRVWRYLSSLYCSPPRWVQLESLHPWLWHQARTPMSSLWNSYHNQLKLMRLIECCDCCILLYNLGSRCSPWVAAHENQQLFLPQLCLWGYNKLVGCKSVCCYR